MNVELEIKKAIGLSKNREYRKAEKIYHSLLKLNPENATVLSCLGWMYYTMGEFKKAEKVLEKAYKIKQTQSLAECLAFVKYGLNKTKESLEYLNQIENDKKSNALTELNINVFIDLNFYKNAYELAFFYNKKYPFLKDSIYYLGFSSICVGNLDEASKYANHLVKFFPSYSNSWYLLGIVNELLYHNDELAFKCFKKQVSCGDKIDGYLNLVISASKQKNFKQAEYYLNKLKKISPNHDEFNFIYASLKFFQRKFKLGFKYYHLKNSPLVDSDPSLKLKKQWDGKICRDKTLLVYGDQGVGDCIMFCRYLPQLEDKFKNIKVAVRPDLIDLLKRSKISRQKFEFIHVMDAFSADYDKSVVMSNLPYYLKADIDNIPYSDSYIYPDDKKVIAYKNKYFNKGGLKVGLCWEAGGAAWREQINRTIHISALEDILSIKEINFYSLQVDPTIDTYKKYDLIDLGQTFKTFDDTAAAIKNLDIIITVDTSVAHLAGAMGIKTFMLLPYVTDWRWFDDTKTTPWYDSIELFKQSNKLSWEHEVSAIKNELLKLDKNVF